MIISMAEQDNIKNKLDKAKQSIANNEKKYLSALRVEAFNRVALFIVCAFISYIALLFLFVICATLFGIEWRAAYDALLEVIKIAVIPITTTVLGYYIGKSS